MRLLDLFCGAGGAAMGYHRAGFDEIVGVDIVPQPNYPFEFVQGDAIEYLTDLVFQYPVNDPEAGWPRPPYAAIHASPPCQGYSTLRHRSSREYPRLIEPTRGLLQEIGLPYVIENVEDARAHLVNPITLCGSSFGLPLRRHRLFETSFPLFSQPCAHRAVNGKFKVYEHGKWYETRFAKVYGSGGGKAKEHWADAMGIDWMTDEEIVEAIPPAYTQFIGDQLMAQLNQPVRLWESSGLEQL